MSDTNTLYTLTLVMALPPESVEETSVPELNTTRRLVVAWIVPLVLHCKASFHSPKQLRSAKYAGTCEPSDMKNTNALSSLLSMQRQELGSMRRMASLAPCNLQVLTCTVSAVLRRSRKRPALIHCMSQGQRCSCTLTETTKG